jgi:hypothetical protein
MDRYSESHLEEFERRVNALRAFLDEHPTLAVPWGRWIADEGFPIVLGEVRRLKEFEHRVLADVLDAEEHIIGSD